jgi:F-type H+-transporting ATPase subunit b
MLDQRRQQIAQGLANTEKINAALAAIDRRSAARYSAARTARRTRTLDETRAVARAPRQQEARKAAAAAEQILRDARAGRCARAHTHAGELRREVGHLVVDATAAVTGKVLTADDQRRLAEETLRKVA